MSANNAGVATAPEAQIKLSSAPRVADQITLLRERISRQERAIETVIVERDRVMERCEQQQELIYFLQQKLRNRSDGERNNDLENHENVDDITAVSLADGTPTVPSRGGNFSRQVPGVPGLRVNSMQSALLSIRGVESTAVDHYPDGAIHRGHEMFDASEFRPIVEKQGAMLKLKYLLLNVSRYIVKFAAVARAKSDVPAH